MAVEHHPVELAGQVSLWSVLAQPHLLDDDFLLELQLGLVETRVDADVGEHLDGRNRARRGEDHVVVREIERGPSVHVSAERFDVSVDEALRARRRSLEEHVLEIVRQPELSRGLVPSPCTHPELDSDDFTEGVLLKEDADPVVQHVAGGRLDRDLRFDLARARTGSGQDQRAEPQKQQNTRYPMHVGCQATTRGATGRMPDPLLGRDRTQRQLAQLRILNK